MNAKHVDKEERRQNILTAAMQVYYEKGFHNMKISDIADRAGIAKGTIYEYFDSKETIFFSIAHSVMESTIQNLFMKEIEYPTVWDKVRTYIINIFSTFSNSDDIMLFMELMITSSKISKHALKGMVGIYNRHVRFFSTIINEGIKKGEFHRVDVERVAFLLFGMIDSLSIKILLGQKFDAKKYQKVALEIIKRALVKPSK